MRYPIVLLITLALTLAACDAGEVTSEAEDLQVIEIVLTDADGEVVAYSHDDHWHGTIRVTAGGEVALQAYVVPADAPASGHDVPPQTAWMNLTDHPEHRLRITSDDEAVAAWSGDRYALTLSSQEAGAALTTVVVLRGTTTLYQSPPAPTLSSSDTSTAAQ
ncbi:MAG: hypothetical protein GVY25_14120 [Bacteroidetes bacterium]|jgi:hypothetical protein|nr:hypothetical protein [Bacteroidota bacterium]